MRIYIKQLAVLTGLLISFSLFAQNTLPYQMPQRIKQGEGASATYLDKANGSWQNCTSAEPGAQDSTCVVPYRKGVAAGLATITASFSPASPITGSGPGRGTTPLWTSANAVRVTMQCSGVNVFALADVPLQGSPSGINFESASPGAMTCQFKAYNSDNEAVTANISATFVDPAPATITASFSPSSLYVGDPNGTSPVWSTTNAITVTVSCANLPAPGWGGSIPTSGMRGDGVSPKIKHGVSPQTVSCTFTATNIIGQVTNQTITANFVMPPPPTVNGWFVPATIRVGESSSWNYASTNSVYTGIVCSGVGFNSGNVVAPNTSWYWFPQVYSTAGTQTCGVHAYNQAGVLAWINVDLIILPASTPPTAVTGGGGTANGGNPVWDPTGPGGDGAASAGCGDSGCSP
jgi:hypothetical protein